MANLINPSDLSDDMLEKILDYWYCGKDFSIYNEFDPNDDEMSLVDFYEVDEPTSKENKFIEKLSQLEIILCVIHWYVYTFCFLYEDEKLFIMDSKNNDCIDFEDYLKEELFRITMDGKHEVMAMNASIR